MLSLRKSIWTFISLSSHEKHYLLPHKHRWYQEPLFKIVFHNFFFIYYCVIGENVFIQKKSQTIWQFYKNKVEVDSATFWRDAEPQKFTYQKIIRFILYLIVISRDIVKGWKKTRHFSNNFQMGWAFDSILN